MTKLFGTDGIRGRVGQAPISADCMLKLGWAVGKVLAQDGRGNVLIGKDTRLSGYMFESALEAGLSSAGLATHLLGPMPTPAVAYLTRTLKARLGIVISASHNAYSDNGIKFFCPNGSKLDKETERKIEECYQQPLTTVESSSLGRAKRIVDAPGRYIEFCKSTFLPTEDLQGLRLVVDCAHGATYHIAPNVFEELGAHVIPLGVEPNGLNINQMCGSTHPEVLSETVVHAKAHIGIALDGDGDRVIMVDENGEVVDGDEMVYIIAKFYAENNRLPGGVVGTVMSNYGLEMTFKEMNIPFVRTSVGDRNILAELKQLGWNLGGEASGHIICLDQTSTGDGIVSALQVLGAIKQSGKTLSELKKGMNKLPQSLLNVPISNKQAVMENESVQKAVHSIESKLNNQGRVLLRPSGTEPVIRVMVEGFDANLVKDLAHDLAEVVEKV